METIVFIDDGVVTLATDVDPNEPGWDKYLAEMEDQHDEVRLVGNETRPEPGWLFDGESWVSPEPATPASESALAEEHALLEAFGKTPDPSPSEMRDALKALLKIQGFEVRT